MAVHETVGLLLPIVIYHSRLQHQQMVLMVDNEALYLGLAKETNEERYNDLHPHKSSAHPQSIYNLQDSCSTSPKGFEHLYENHGQSIKEKRNNQR
jgi:hypothetical protein